MSTWRLQESGFGRKRIRSARDNSVVRVHTGFGIVWNLSFPGLEEYEKVFVFPVFAPIKFL